MRYSACRKVNSCVIPTVMRDIKVQMHKYKTTAIFRREIRAVSGVITEGKICLTLINPHRSKI